MTAGTGTTTETTFMMPSLGADMTEGRITEWLVEPGDRVERGQIVLIVETDKADIDVEVFEPATVLELLVAEGEVVPVGTPIARLGADTDVDADVDAGVESRASSARVTSPVIRHLADELHVDPARLHGSGPGGRVHRDDVEAAVHGRPRHTPRARRLMAEHAVDPASVGDLGVVTGADVLAHLARPADPATATTPEERPSRAETMRRHIADLMSRSWAEIPHFHVSSRLDLATANDRLAEVNADRSAGDRIVVGALLLAATARVAASVPACNGWWRDDAFEPASTVDLGVVLSLRSGGIIVPTIRDADQLTPRDLMARLDELVQRARQGRLRASDLSEASITVTNLGDRGADAVAGVIHPPQVAIVGFGAVRDEIWPVEGAPTVRPTVHASLAGDHRAIDGLAGSRFLTRLQSQLDGPVLDDC